MANMKFPVNIITQRMFKPRMEIYYPQVSGLANTIVQGKINSAILRLLNTLLVGSDYYNNQAVTGNTWYEIKTNERGILSLTLAIYYFSGGAHGMTVVKSLTFDTDTGKSYSLAELFNTGSDYVKVLSAQVQQQITQRSIQLLDTFKGIQPDQDYYIADQSLVIYFQLYDITPYAAGLQYFPISIYNIQDIINENGPLGKMFGSL